MQELQCLVPSTMY